MLKNLISISGKKLSPKTSPVNIFTLFLLIILFLVSVTACEKGTSVESNNEVDNSALDFLTPEYYQSAGSDPFVAEVDSFLFYTRMENNHHPLKNASGQLPDYSLSSLGVFGAPKGPSGSTQHHPAVDLFVGNREVDVNIYAVHGGIVSTVKDADKYRHYLAITKEIEDDNGKLLGKLVTLYAHIDLDLDEQDSLSLNGTTVNKGDLISTHLYGSTVGGPHLHFEIRYYRPADAGDETFYGSIYGPGGNADLTEPSAGSWTYGTWHPNVGYGFGNPLNHDLIFE